MAPVIAELEKHPAQFTTTVCSTGQHREMLDQVLQLFDIAPDYDLDVMVDNQTLPKLTSRLVTALSTVCTEVQPDVALVHGDTATALAGALAAYYNQIPVGHVEAGLRTYDRYQPFPEEMNRHLVDVLSTYQFAPTATAREHLISEGSDPSGIHVTGNTVIDALFMALQKPCPLPIETNDQSRRTILVTAHRRENLGEPLKNICLALLEICEEYPDVEIVYPVHYNPNVREQVYSLLAGHERIHLTEPLDYLEFVHLIDQSHIILTDSGGIQEEAPALGVPVLVLRDVTERPEAVEAGTVRLVGTTVSGIVGAFHELTQPAVYQEMAQSANPYGDGTAARQIVRTLATPRPKTHVVETNEP